MLSRIPLFALLLALVATVYAQDQNQNQTGAQGQDQGGNVAYAHVQINVPEYTMYTNASNRGDGFLGPGSQSITIDQEFIDNHWAYDFLWYLYFPNKPDAYTKFYPTWNMTCYILAHSTSDEITTFDLHYSEPFITGPSNANARVWCPPDQARCLKQCVGEEPNCVDDCGDVPQPQVDSDTL